MIIKRKCRKCNKKVEIEVIQERYNLWVSGSAHIQYAMPELSEGEREMLLSGICEKCFDNLFIGFN